MTRKPSEELLTGRRALDDISQLQILRDWEWFDKQSKWALRFALAPEFTRTEFIPPRTEWYVVVEDRYPAGDIKLYPATHDGITATFQHQSLNRETDDSPWRTGGHLCRDQFSIARPRRVRRRAEDGARKAHWLAQRAIEWLIAASQDDLVRPGEPFELPVVNFRNDEELAFVENDSRYEQWTKNPDQYGLCVAASIPAIPGWRIMKFQTKAASLNSDWGTVIAETDDSGKQAMWIRCSKIPDRSPVAVS